MKVAAACSDYLFSKNTCPTIMSKVFMRNGTYPLIFSGWVYKTASVQKISCALSVRKAAQWLRSFLQKFGSGIPPHVPI